MIEILTSKCFWKTKNTLTVSTGCINAVDNAQESPPANADFRTFPAGISTGGGTATTVAASNQIFLYLYTTKTPTYAKRFRNRLMP